MTSGRGGWRLAVAAVLLGLAAPGAAQGAAAPTPLVVSPGYTARVFAMGGTRYSHPAALATLNGLIYVGYDNNTVADGSDGGSSTVVAYTAGGTIAQTYAITGSISTLRSDPRHKVIYAVLNRLGNSALATITLGKKVAVGITLPANPPHGGGFGDVVLVGDSLYASASNPTLDQTGTNAAPALDKLSVVKAAATAAPVVMGNGKATDVTTNQPVTLNEVDPTTLAVTPGGDVMMINQAGSEVVFVHKPATVKPSLTSLLTGTQLVEVAWTAAGKGRLLVADTEAGAVYAIDGTYTAGAPFAISASGSGVSGLLGTLSLTTGAIKPFGFGFKEPSALLFTH